MQQLDTKAVWSDSVAAEIGYWGRTIKKDPAAFQERYHRAQPVNEFLPGLVDLLPMSGVSLLDVGSGPAPVVIGRYSKPVEIVACDPLADDYTRLLERHGIDSPVDLVRADGELLVERFGTDRFDIAHIQNALDHSYQPVSIVRQMVTCTKPGGLVLIRSVINEGSNENFHGLHQWDVSPGVGDFSIRHRHGEPVAMRTLLEDAVEDILVGTHSVLAAGSEIQDWMDVVLVRKGAPAGFVDAVQAEFCATQVRLGQQLARAALERDEGTATPRSRVAARDAEVAWLRMRVQQLEAEARRYRRTVSRLRARNTMLADSTSYQLGRLLVRAVQSPARIPGLPRDLVRLHRARRRQLSTRISGSPG